MSLFAAKTFTTFIGTLPATTLTAQWESHVAKVGGKAFALLAQDGSVIVFKVTELSFDGLTTIPGIVQASYFAKRQWVAVGRDAALPAADLKAYLRQSQALIAAKLTRKLRAELGLTP